MKMRQSFGSDESYRFGFYYDYCYFLHEMGLCGKMPKTLVFQLLIAVIFNFILSVHTLEVDLTVDVKPGHEECFYEEIKKPTSLEVEYQVGLTFLQTLTKYSY